MRLQTRSIAESLEARVRSALAGELQTAVLDGDIAIRVEATMLHLRGRLPSVAAKKRALFAASRVAPSGITLVDGLRVVPSVPMTDERTAVDVLERLFHSEALRDCAVGLSCGADIVRARRPGPWIRGEVVVTTHDGEVHLFGRVERNRQRAIAEAVAWQCFGTTNVINRLEVASEYGVDDEVTTEVVSYVLQHEPSLAGCLFRPSVRDGQVQLEGRVSSHLLQQVAEGNVWMVPGVREVSNELQLTGSGKA